MVKDVVPWRTVQELDREGMRIGVGKGAAYALCLSRHLEHASLVSGGRSPDAIRLFVEGEADCAAGVRQPLEAYAAAHEGYRVLPDSFTSIQQAMAVPKGRKTAQAFLQTFIAEMKANGFVAQALENSQQTR